MMTPALRSHQHAELADYARTLGHAHRLLLLEQISRGEKPVEQLAELTDLTVANTSQHLQHLRRSGFVCTRRDGKRVYYRLGSGPIEEIIRALRAYAQHTRDGIRTLIDDPLNSKGTLDSITHDELAALLASGGVTILDVRTGEEYSSGHLPGAINIPVSELEMRLAELPRGQEIVAYCRGPFCILSTDAAAILDAKGFQVRRLAAGFSEWKAAGFDVEDES